MIQCNNIYIYIYVRESANYIDMARRLRRAGLRVRHVCAHGSRKGTNGVSTNGVTANLMLFDRGTFWVIPLTYFDLYKKCQGVPFSPVCQNSLPLQRPISVDIICPQPRLARRRAGHGPPGEGRRAGVVAPRDLADWTNTFDE